MLRTGKIPIGICGFAKRDYLDDPDLGFAFLPEYEGFGYAYEAAILCMKYAVNVLNFKIITAITVRSNVRSIKLLEKLNMKYKRTISAPNDNEELLLFINHEN
jgi:RimJ/RimL family protein N-acetyltransferase